MINTTGVDVGHVLDANNNIYYPSSIGNMRNQLSKIVLADFSFIEINERNQPLFMRTAQSGSYQPAGFLHVIPLCYVLPGEGSKIVSRIKLSQFDFKQFDFDVDRLIVDSSLDNSIAKYLLFPRQTITDRIPEDDVLYGQDMVLLTDEESAPINRE
jgi:hypothetical protein